MMDITVIIFSGNRGRENINIFTCLFSHITSVFTEVIEFFPLGVWKYDTDMSFFSFLSFILVHLSG